MQNERFLRKENYIWHKTVTIARFLCNYFRVEKEYSIVENNNVTAPISFTPKAEQELKRLTNTLNITPEQGVRVGVKGGGCAGMSYLLAFDHQEADDNVYDVNGFKLLIKKSGLMHLVGLQIDWQDTTEGKGFIFNVNTPS